MHLHKVEKHPFVHQPWQTWWMQGNLKLNCDQELNTAASSMWLSTLFSEMKLALNSIGNVAGGCRILGKSSISDVEIWSTRWPGTALRLKQKQTWIQETYRLAECLFLWHSTSVFWPSRRLWFQLWYSTSTWLNSVLCIQLWSANIAES